MSQDAITTPDEIEETEDLLQGELEQDQGLLFEETRHTALLHMIEKDKVAFTTKIEKKQFDKIMRMLTFVRMYKLEMEDAMEKNPFIKKAVIKNCNLYLEQIRDYFQLMKAKDGWTAENIYKILMAEEKTAKKYGLFGQSKIDRELEE